jgi:hypothetical protein
MIVWIAEAEKRVARLERLVAALKELYRCRTDGEVARSLRELRTAENFPVDGQTRRE